MHANNLTGRYVLAVSGGVDSMVLLDMLAKSGKTEVIVAHFNHGMRADSGKDEEFVAATAQNYGLELEVGRGRLGAKASEDDARRARYKFLDEAKQKHRAVGIVTAHHQDDLIETAFLNLLRGSGRRGLSAIADSDITRPLLNTPKADILKYAQNNQLKWREDSTNAESVYLRNYLRNQVLQDLSDKERQAVIGNIEKVAEINKKLNKQIATLSHKVNKDNLINRGKFIALPGEIANELIMLWLRELDMQQFDKKMVNRLALALKTGQPNTSQPINANWRLKIGKTTAHFADA